MCNAKSNQRNAESISKTYLRVGLPSHAILTFSQKKQYSKYSCRSDRCFTILSFIRSLRAYGGTPLGPALLVAVSIAGQVPGSKVVICTDGMANEGLGSLEYIDRSERQRNEVEGFYSRISDKATDKGCSLTC